MELPDLTPDQLEVLQDMRDYELSLAYSHWNQDPARPPRLALDATTCHPAAATAGNLLPMLQPRD